MNAYELADIIEDDMEDGFGMGFLKDAVSMLRQQQAEIEALQSAISGNKEVMADWEAELKSVREMNTICWRSNRAKQAEIEELKAELHKYKPQIWEVMKEANNERK